MCTCMYAYVQSYVYTCIHTYICTYHRSCKMSIINRVVSKRKWAACRNPSWHYQCRNYGS